MFKLIPLILSLSLIGVGGTVISVKNSDYSIAEINLQNYMRENNNIYLNSPDNSDLFLKANTNPSL